MLLCSTFVSDARNLNYFVFMLILGCMHFAVIFVIKMKLKKFILDTRYILKDTIQYNDNITKKKKTNNKK